MPAAPSPHGQRAILVGVAFVALTWMAVLQADISPLVTQASANLGTAGAALLAATGCALAARRHHGRPRLVWALLAASAASWGTGQGIWSFHELVLGDELPFPSLADAGFLGAVPLAVAALLLVPSGADSAAGRVRTVIDGLVVAGSLLLLSWLTLLGPVLLADEDGGLTTLISLAYPVGDIVLVTIVVYVLLSTERHRAERTLPLGLVGCGLVGLAVADSGFAYLTAADAYRTGHPIDAGWFVGYLLLFAASTRRTVPGPSGRSGAGARLLSTVLPYTAVLAAVAVTVVQVAPTGQVHAMTVVGWAVVMTLVLLRQVLTLLENQRLADALRARIDEVHASEQRFRALVQHSSDIVTLVDLQGVVRYQSESISHILGHDPADVLDRPIFGLLGTEEGADLIAAIHEHAGQPRSQCTLELSMLDGEGRAHPVEVTMTNLLDEPSVDGVVLNIRDISEQRALEVELVHQAFHDSLTSLANRALFKDRLEHALSRRTPASGGELAVLFCDLDGFKDINDSLGHAAGDALLVEVAGRLAACVRPGDTIARLGGDEFAVLIEDAGDAADATAVAERIQAALEAPFALGDRPVHVSASIGIAAARHGTDGCDQLLRNADLAMYRAKAEGGGIRLFDDRMHADLVEQLAMEADLARAITDGELVLHYQPTFEIASGRPTGVEALVRWQHPERGLLPPGAFIADAERTGLIVPLGTWVLTEACRQAVAWQGAFPAGEPLTMSVNVSTRQLTPAFPAVVASILAETGMPAAQLVLEITESMLVDDEGSVAVLTELKSLGIRIAVDDFGTGYSSLSYLHRYPVDLLKIDRSFVGRIREAGGASEMITAIVQLAHSLQLSTVAEGIEDGADLDELRRIGCELGQGFHLARPASADDIAALLGLTGPVSLPATASAAPTSTI